MVAIMGPSGCGKTTLLNCLSGLDAIDAGEILIEGTPLSAMSDRQRTDYRARRMGFVFQFYNLIPVLTAVENVELPLLVARVAGGEARERALAALDLVGLAGRAGHVPDALSGGERQRVTIARSLVNDPEVMLLDEPTTGLDPQARHVVWDRLYRLKRQGTTLLLTTHYMDEAEQLCDRLVVMDRGKIVAEGSPRDLIERYSTREVVELRFDDGNRPEDLSYWTEGLVTRIEALPDRVLLYTQDGDAASHGIHERGLVPESLLVRRSTLEDVFLHLTGRSLIE
jgi:lipooligosaccharide transport system ATP-binding protein